MALLRITLDIIVKDTPAARTKIQNWWINFKDNRALFKAISQTDEESFIKIHLCNHDEIPLGSCTLKKYIVLNDIIQEDAI